MESVFPYEYIKQEVNEEEETPVAAWMEFNDCLLDSSQATIKQEVNDDKATGVILDSLLQPDGLLSDNLVKIKSEENHGVKNDDELAATQELKYLPQCKQEVLVVPKSFKSDQDLDIKNDDELAATQELKCLPQCKQEVLVVPTSFNSEEDLDIKDNIIGYENDPVFFCEYWKDTQNPFVDNDGPDWRENIEDETGDAVGLYFCNDCHFSTSSKAALQEHIFQHFHQNETFRRKTFRLNTKEKTLCCKFCDFETVHRISMNLHRSMHAGGKRFRCESCNFKTKSLNSLDQHKSFQHNEKISECDLDGGRSDALKKHTLITAPKKSVLYSCAHCDFQTFFKNNLKVHVVCKHTTDKPMSCRFCPYKSACASNFNRHMSTVHGNRKRRRSQKTCKFCSFSTDCTTKLENHERSKHTKEKPFSCQFCGKTFVSCEGKNEHELNIHNRTNEFECEHCDYVGNTVKYFKRHVVEKHLKPFHCDVCGYKCGRKSDLKIHMSKHSSRKTFACDICNYTTTCAQYLSSHVKRIHK